MAFWRPPSRETNTGFGKINGEMHDEIKKRQPPERRIDGKRNRQRKGCMDRAVHGQRCKPTGSLLLPASHPAVLQTKSASNFLISNRMKTRMINPSGNSIASNSEKLIAGYCPPHFPIWQDNQNSGFNCPNYNQKARGTVELGPIRYVLQPGCAFNMRSVDAGNFPSLLAGRIGLGTKSPPQFGHLPPRSRFSTQSAQNVHSNEQMSASTASGGKSASQHSQFGLSSSIRAYPNSAPLDQGASDRQDAAFALKRNRSGFSGHGPTDTIQPHV